MIRRPRAPGAYLLLAGVLLLAWHHARPGLYATWTPSDEGVLAQSAERVLRGELPHRDFDALWSGGLDWLNAGAFRVLGTRLSSLRELLIVAWLVGLAAMFDAARRFLPAWGAALIVWCAALWTLPLSQHPLPSWYNLVFALIGAACVLRAIDGRTRGWMFAAGMAAGASIAVKIVGLYFVAAVFLFCVFHAQELAPAPRGPGAPGPRNPRWTRWYGWLVTAGLVTYLAGVLKLIAYAPTANMLLQFFVPSAALVTVLLVREWRSDGSSDGARVRALFSLALPFVAGLAVVVGAWVAPYVQSGAVHALLYGLFVAPRLRFDVATYALPGLKSAGLSVLPVALLVALAPFVRQPLRRADRWALGIFAALFVASANDGSPITLITWYAFRALTPCVSLLAAWWLLRPPRGEAIGEGRRSAAFFLVSAAAACSLVQIPFALYTYFLYFVPLLILGAAALWSALPRMPWEVPLALVVMVIAFRLREPADVAKKPGAAPPPALAMLAGPRGGLMVSREDSQRYARLNEEVHRRATSDWLYVWHDSPETYFLTGMRNPTRTLLEVFAHPETQTPEAIEAMLRAKDVSVVVLTPPWGAVRPMPPELRRWIEARYPSVAWVGNVEVLGRSIVR